MKVLVTGANGMLGEAVCAIFAMKHEVLGFSRTRLDVTDETAVRACLLEECPDCVIHLAAMTNVDYCEEHPILAHRVNTQATSHISAACQEIEAVLVFLSSIAVFDGEKTGPYDEQDEPNPINVYGRSKLGAEKLVRVAPKHYVLRTSWLFGGEERDKKFVQLVLRLSKTYSIVRIVDDKLGSPTYTVDLANGISRILEEGMPFGTYHLANSGSPVSRYDLAKRIIETKGLDTTLKPVSSDYFPGLAPRPQMEACCSEYLAGWLRPWSDALEDYLNHS